MTDAVLTWLFTSWAAGVSNRDGEGSRAPNARNTERSRPAAGIAERTKGRDRDQEREWIAGLRAGRADVFRAIFEAYARPLQQFAQVWVPSDVAEDMTQDVLFDIWQRRATLTIQNEHLTAYLYSAVRKRAAMYLRHKGVVTRLTSTGEDAGSLGMGTAPLAPDDQVVLDDFHTAMAAAMTQLSELQRAVLILRWTRGLSYHEISATLAVSENAARLHMSRARQILRPVLDRYIGDLD